MFDRGPCEGCQIRDQTIADLRDQLREAHKTALAVIDSKAYTTRYLAEAALNRGRGPRKDEEAQATSPEEFRRRRFQGTLTSEEAERSFAAEAEIANAGAVASGPRGIDEA
jgi:hypothetical protein